MKNELTKRDNYDFFDAAMNDLFPGFYGFNARNVQRYMRTDIKESDEGYTMEVEVPGVDKSDIRLDLKEGYLTISVNKSEKQESGKKENYIHRERSFSCSRSYYVGDISKDEIKASARTRSRRSTRTVCSTSLSPRRIRRRRKRAISRSSNKKGRSSAPFLCVLRVPLHPLFLCREGGFYASGTSEGCGRRPFFTQKSLSRSGGGA